jgi:hypothetical protein
MLKFGLTTLKAMPRLFAYRNDVDIFTEDRIADKEFYKTLFKNLFGDDLKIHDITPLGCKSNVLSAYDSQNPSDKRRKYYIVDGDLDLIIGTNRKNEKNLIILDSYCIENYLIEENACVDLIYFSNGTEPKESIKLKLKFENWLSYNAKCLVELFINFGILRKYGGGPVLKTAHDFLTVNGKQTILDKTKIENYSQTIKADIINLLTTKGYPDPNDTYLSDYNALTRQWGTGKSSLLQIVSAKNYILPLLQFRINHCVNKGKTIIPKESIKLYLAEHCELDRLKFLKTRIK